MKHLATTCIAALAVLLLAAQSADAQIDAELIAAGKAATGLVVRPTDEGSGTTFCIDKRGYFITNEHVVAGVKDDDTLTIVMRPATDDEYTLTAKIVDIDRDNDLALLKAELGEHKPGVLELAGDKPPIETAQLIAFGFPFGELLSFNNEYPAVSVNIGRVTSLRKRDGELRAIQTDTSLTFGNSGGPMLNTQGQVAGVVISGLPGTGINFAIPAQQVTKFLRTPRIAFTDPEPIAYADRHKPLELSIRLDAFSSGDKPYEVTFEVEHDGQTQGVTAKAGEDGVYTAKIMPAPAPQVIEKTDGKLEIEAAFESGRIGCKIKDMQLRLDQHTIALSDILLLDQRKAKVRIVKRDGTEVTGDKLLVQAVNVDLGGASVRLDLGKAQWLRIKHPDLNPTEATGFTAPLRIRVAQGDKVLAERSHTLHILDPLAINEGNLPGGFGTEDPDLPGNALVFDARKDKKPGGWTASVELPDTKDGALVIEGQRNTTLTYNKDIELERLTIEFETVDRGQAFFINYGANRYRVHVSDSWIGFPDPRDASGHRVLTSVKADLKGRQRVTIAFPRRGLTSITNGETTLAGKRRGFGELSITIDGQHAFKIYRIEMIPRSGPLDESMIETGSVYKPPAGAAVVEQDDVTVTLPAAYTSFDVGGGGRYMLFHIQSNKTIQIIDIVKGKIVHTMENVWDDVIIAAGLEHFVLVRPGQKIMQKWSYAGFERVKVARLPGNGQTRLALLGANSTGPMLLAADDTVLVDLHTLREIETVGDPLHKLHQDTHGSADNRTFGTVEGGGYKRIHIDGGYVSTHNIGEQGYARRFAKPSADGRLVFCLNSRVFDHAVNELAVDWLKGMTCYPTTDPRYFLAVRIVDAKKPKPYAMHVNICTTADRKIVDTIVGLPAMSPTKEYNHRNQVGGWLRDGWPVFHYVPWAKALVTVRWDKKSVRVKKHDLLERLASQGLDFLFVQSAPPVYAPLGGRVVYQVDAVSSSKGLTFELLDGPAGAVVNESGLITWEVPAKQDRDKETIILSIRNSAGEEVLHSFDLTYQ